MTSTPIGRTRRSFCASVLALEAFVIWFAILAAATLSDVDLTLVLSGGVGLAIACLVTAGLLRYRWAYVVGSMLQIALVLSGFIVSTMFFLGGIFLVLWVVAWRLGGRLDEEKAARGG
ncbi:MAG TPA: DUF4233 domain-containing protein [Acidothermales bacterium]